MFFLKNKIRSILTTKNIRTTYDIFALQKLAGIVKNYIPWTSSSIRPSAIVKVINDIFLNKRENIIEFGGGMSTFYIAYALKKNYGHLYTVEHDKNWIVIMKDILKKEHIEDVVTFIHAPLGNSTYSLNALNWYSENALDALSNCNKFDLVLVDGPFAHTKKLSLSRYPAIPFLMKKDKISRNSTIILDDIYRNGEQTIVKKWGKEYGLKFTNLHEDGGIAISNNGNFYNIS